MTTVPHLAFSHLGFHVYDLARMEDFYTRVLGFAVTDRGVGRGADLVFLSRDPREHHQIVLASGRTGDPGERTLNQISFRLGSLADLRAMHDRVGAEPEVGDINPINHGTAWSVYFRDPEGNRIELFVDSPWYVSQPVIDPLDLSLSDNDILRLTRERYGGEKEFQPVERWRADFSRNPNVNPNVS